MTSGKAQAHATATPNELRARRALTDLVRSFEVQGPGTQIARGPNVLALLQQAAPWEGSGQGFDSHASLLRRAQRLLRG